MKITKQEIYGAAILAMLTTGSTPSFGQTNPNFNQIAPNIEGAIRLSWDSAPGEVYQIQCADSLIDINTGAITWQVLYDDYPSQGTNTFWLDTGNYFTTPPILHPAIAPMRFYRIVDRGPDTTSTEPTVMIVSPTNGLTVSGELTINVEASTDQAGPLVTLLYVDGQEMWPLPDTSTNWTDASGVTNYLIDTYTINTCEWPNGPHTLFATAAATSAWTGPASVPPVLYGHGVSLFVTATFNNLVTRISFSEPFFDPALGQTQQVSAVFAANVNWTLVVRDVNSNAVRTATGTGASMLFPWDGNGDGGTNLDPGVYYYYISAQTNGQALQSSGSDSGSGSPALPSFSSAISGSGTGPTELLAVPADGSGSVVPLILYPPGTDTNGFIIFEGSMADILPRSATGIQAGSFIPMDGGTGGASPDYSGASSQAAPPAPQRPPTAPKDGTVGTFGLAWQTYTTNGTNGFTPPLPLATTPPLYTYVQMEGHGTANPPTFDQMPGVALEVNGFGGALLNAGWSAGPIKSDDGLNIGDLRGGGTPFNQPDIVLLALHCEYGTSFDYLAGPHPVKQMYFPITAGTGAQYLRMSEMQFGGDGTNGLKWIAIDACNSLYHVNWANMQSQQVYPYTSGLHLMLGADTINATHPHLGVCWAKFMLGNPKSVPPKPPEAIRLAWYDGATYAFTNWPAPIGATITFAVAGDPACLNDMLQTKTNTVLSGGSWFYDTRQVYPPQ